MAVRLDGKHLERFQADLRAHRARHALGDAEYAETVLNVSLNTYKKCVQARGGAALNLKRHTFTSIFAKAGLSPKRYGLAFALPSGESPFGGYDKRDYAFVCGRFHLYRRSFLTARNITRSVLAIASDGARDCLTFHEVHYYVSDSGVRDEQHYQGDIYIDKDRSLIGMPAFFEGQVRLTLVNVPQRPSGREKIKMRGALLAYGVPNGYWQPTLSCVFVEGPVEAKTTRLRDLCATVPAGSPEFTRVSAELALAEERATINTPLMWFKQQQDVVRSAASYRPVDSP